VSNVALRQASRLNRALAAITLTALLGAGAVVLAIPELRDFGLIGMVLAALAFAASVLAVGRETLCRQKALLDVAVGNIVQGLCMFDSDGRLLLCNDRYLDMYGLSPALVKPGCSLHDLMVWRKQAGTFSGDPAQYVAERLGEFRRGVLDSELVTELDDGRVIKLVNRPTHDGGWVATHEEITVLRRRERELADMRQFLELVIDNVPAAISVKDAKDLRYVLVNRAGEEIYGVPREKMIGKTISDLAPGKAGIIEARDRSVLESRAAQAFSDIAYDSPKLGRRIHMSRRVPVFDENGEPRYLLLVIQDVTEQRRAEERVAHLALHDPLTDLPNRVAFNERLGTEIERAAAAHEKLSVLCLDLHRFKDINDVFGHSVGDELLRQLAARLSAVSEGQFLARLGGDEFALIGTDQRLPGSAAELADRLLAAVADGFEINGSHVDVGLRIGIAIYPGDGADQTALLANLDAALYRAKAEGHDSIHFFEADMDRRLREARAMTHDLRSAIDRDQLVLHYQPLASRDGDIVGFEALVRWQHPTQGLVAPGVFIPLAEENGLIGDLGEWVLREACREAASWPKPLRIAVNVSPAQFRTGDLAGMVHTVLLETGLAPGRLEIEITESVLVDDFPRAVAILRRLRALGVHIAMDDFGTGYSSLKNLQSFPFDKLKIDASFISDLEINPQSATIVRAVVGLARGLKMPVLAEGVETEHQFEFLAAEGCDELQGYLIGRPQPIAAYAEVVGRAAGPIPVRRRPRRPAA